jgi:hypothetical protein
MSKIALSGNASGTGTFTIASPDSSTDRTLNLPDAAGTIQVSGNPISGTTGTFTGLVDISAAGAGQIAFPATQNASANANTLDDYEEGTFTPSITGRSFATAIGSYVKVGRVCTVSLVLNNLNSAISGDINISGLPFTAIEVTAGYGANSIAMTEVSGVSFASIPGFAPFLMYGRVQQGTATIQLLQTNGAAHDSFSVGGSLQIGATVRVSFSYLTLA